MFWIICVWYVIVCAHGEFDLDYKAKKVIDNAEKEFLVHMEKSIFDEWAFATNITEETKKRADASSMKLSKLAHNIWEETQKFDLSKIKCKSLKRKLKMLSIIGPAGLPDNKSKQFIELTSNMAEKYNTAKVLDFETKKKRYSLDPELTEIFRKSRKPEELQYYWEQWRQSSGKQMRTKYHTFVELYNEAAKINGFKDASIMKVHQYESKTFIQDMEDTWQGLKPFYEHLHAYVRNRLHKFYGGKVVTNSGPIPAHLLGNMWAQDWGNLADLLKPFPNKSSSNVTGEMIRQSWTTKKMFKTAEDFFKSIGFDKMLETFWSGSMLEKPKDGREVECSGSAWDFFNGKDFRIKMCTMVTQEDLSTIHHEMGHIQYFLQYNNLSYLYRDGANPGFHEAVADILTLSFRSPTYLQSLGLLSNDVDITDHETEINLLLEMALDKIAFLPWGYLVDKFRWDVFSGKSSLENMNCHWWKLRYEIQGMSPPSKRSYEQFDPGAKFHIATDDGYVKYFTARIYQFQFYRAMCLISGEYVPGDPEKPLHRCNFYGSHEAGDKLREMEKMGSSKPWMDAMEKMTGQRKMNPEAIREYFKPLEDWLKAENNRTGAIVGWGLLDLDEVCQQHKRAGLQPDPY